MPKFAPFISIFIPTYNDVKDLTACIESLRKLEYPRKRMELIIWDNASSDNTVEMVKESFGQMNGERWHRLLLIPWESNEGSYIPYNLGLSRLNSKSRFILGLDADVELKSDSLSRLVDAAMSERVAVVGARSIYFDSPHMTSHGAGFVNKWTGRYKVLDLLEQVDCDYVIGCCWLLSKDIFKKLGGFDPDYYINHWEVDYCLRAKRQGYNVIYEPKAIARHKIHRGGQLSEERLYYLYRNKPLLIRKTFCSPHRQIAFISVLISLFPKAILDSILRNRRFNLQETNLIITAMIDGLRGMVGKKFG